MSEEKDISLRFKEILKKAKMKHSTPVEVSSTLSKNRSSLYSSAFLSPVPKKSFQLFEDGPQLTKAWTSWGLLQRKLSIGSSLGSDTTNSSQFRFPRRPLSTIIGSEESNEVLSQAVVLSMTPRKRTRESSELPAKHWELPTRRASTLKKSPAKSTMKKKKLAKKLVEERVRAWELRQLINIEEATTHELTIEEV